MATDSGVVLLLIVAAGSLWFAVAGLMWAMLAAFRDGLGPGLLCWLVPFYAWYFALTRYRGEDQGLLISLVVGTHVVNGVATTLLILADGAGALALFYQHTWVLLAPALPGTAVVGVVLRLTRGAPAGAEVEE